VAEVECGTGLLSILAAKAGAEEIWATGTDPEVLLAAVENAERNGVSRIMFVHGHLLDPVPGPLDLVVANLLPAEERRPVDPEFFSGGDNTNLILALIGQAKALLRPGGRLLLHLDRVTQGTRVRTALEAHFRIRKRLEYPRPFLPSEVTAASPGYFDHLDTRRQHGPTRFQGLPGAAIFLARLYDAVRL
jgi:methylase of polypeptide subunit release factors